MPTNSLHFQLQKYDPFQGKFWATATMGGVVDRAGERLDYPGTKPYFQKLADEMSSVSEGKNLCPVHLQHDPNKLVGQIVKYTFDDENQRIEVEGLAVDPVAKEFLQQRTVTGVSIGGRYVKRTKGSDGVVDFIADPNEISLVDRPCLPQATFKMVKDEAGTAVLMKFANKETSAALVEKYFPTMTPEVKKTLAALEASAAALQKEIAEVVAKFPVGPPQPSQGDPDPDNDDDAEEHDDPSARPDPNRPDPTETVDRPAVPMVKACTCKMCSTCVKRDFSDKKRKEMADAGTAMPDGSFPIANRSDLENAIQAVGRAKDYDKAKAHIIARAKALGATSELPESWNVSKSDFPTHKEDTMSKELTADELKKAAKSIAEHLAAHKALHTAHKDAMCKAAAEHEASGHEMCDKCYKALTGEDTVPMETTKADGTKNDLKKDAPVNTNDITDEKLAEITAAAVKKALGIEDPKPETLEERVAKAVAKAIEPLTKSNPNQPRPRFVENDNKDNGKLSDEDVAKLAAKARTGDREAVRKMFADTASEQVAQRTN